LIKRIMEKRMTRVRSKNDKENRYLLLIV